jgi:hypothetical protein
MTSRSKAATRVSSFTVGFTEATSNCGLAGGVCARKVVQIKAIAAHTTYRIVNLLTLLCEAALRNEPRRGHLSDLVDDHNVTGSVLCQPHNPESRLDSRELPVKSAAQALKRNDVAGDAFKAAAAYRYARTWDVRGWFWSPSADALDRLEDLK